MFIDLENINNYEEYSWMEKMFANMTNIQEFKEKCII